MKLMTLLQRELADPRVAGVHVTRVEMSRDLARAHVFYRTTPGEATPEEAAAGLESARGFLRGHLGRSLRLRRAPELDLAFDELPERGERVDALLAGLDGAARARTEDEDEDEEE